MNEMKLIIPAVVKVCYSPKNGSDFNSYSIEMPVAPGQDPMEFVISLHAELKAKVTSLAPQAPQAPTQPAYNQTPNCQLCGAAMRLNKKGDYWNCINAKWDMTTKLNIGCRGYQRVAG